MAINVAQKYAKKLAMIDTLKSVIAGRTNQDYEWDGTKAINVWTPVAQSLNDYDRNGGMQRYGTPKEMEDTLQTLTVNKEKSYSISVDKGNASDQMGIKKAGVVVKVQQEEVQTPFWDKDALSTWAKWEGIKKITVGALDKDNIVDMFIKARTQLVNKKVTMSPETCTAYIKASAYEFLEKNPSLLGVESLAKELLTFGTVGKCKTFLVKEVPDDYLPENTPILFTVKKACLAVKKLNSLKIHDNPPGIDGILVEARDYGDSFVMNVFKEQIVAVNTTAQPAE